jgi:DNA-directed RNA polymerase specialized sigma24 family protein
MKKKVSQLKQSPLKKAKKVKPHYVDPEVFSNLIVKSYKDTIISDELAESVLKIATRLSYAPNFINYSYRDEMIGDAIVKMLYAIKNKKFDPKVGNAFSYFTRIAFNAFCNRIKKEKKEKEFILNLQDNVYDDIMGAGFKEDSEDNENMYYYDN